MRRWLLIGSVLLWGMVCLTQLSVVANNVQLKEKALVEVYGGKTTVALTLSWDNSWRDGLNWDAVYLFLKYRVAGTNGLWHPVQLDVTGHTVPSNLEIWPAKSGGLVCGTFVQRTANGNGEIAASTVRLTWAAEQWSENLKAAMDAGRLEVVAFAVEMVYIPRGAFGAGDGVSTNSYYYSSRSTPFMIEAEETPLNIYSDGGSSSINAAYPKGYNGFYCMKYEISQEQYASFLNKLTYAQQAQRIGNALDALAPGSYAFGTPEAPADRNGIVVSKKENGRAAIFAHDLNHNGTYSEDGDGQTVACNYLTPEDMLAYCAWSGLRPMSELEYEKACRPDYPSMPVGGEYAWITTDIPGRATGVSAGGTVTEKPNAGNVNAGNSFGPVRCGSFAGSTTYRKEAGATWWGVMEMSGNLAELCYNTNYAGSAFNGAHGLGEYATSLAGWPVNANQFALRGGSFASADGELRVSDRSQANGKFSSVNAPRDKKVTFRGVRNVPDNSVVSFSGGTIACVNGKDSSAIMGGEDFCFIDNKTVASGGIGSIRYVWYYRKDGGAWQAIPSQGETSITFAGLDSNPAKVIAYDFRRKALCAVNDAFSNVATVQVIPQMKLSSTTIQVVGAVGTKVVATLALPAKVTWKTSSGKVLKTEANVKTSDYTFKFSDLPIAPGASGKAFCEADYAVGKENKPITVALGPDFIYDDDRNGGNLYPIAKMADGRYWMQTNLRRTDVTYRYAGGDVANAEAHGCYYAWSVAMAGSTTEGARGICPAGWHIPTSADWHNLIDIYGGVNSAGLGLQLPGGLNLTLSGFARPGSTSSSGFRNYALNWSSKNETYFGASLGLKNVDADANGTSLLLSVRCIKDL